MVILTQSYWFLKFTMKFQVKVVKISGYEFVKSSQNVGQVH